MGLIILFIISNPLYESVEKNIYLNYSKSMTLDGDLNLTNQVPAKELWQVTKTFNYPDVHSNGVIASWSPFFLYLKVINGLVSSDETDYKVVRSFISILFALLNLGLVAHLLKHFKLVYNLQHVKVSNVILTCLFSTSYLWFTVIQAGNADITMSLLTTVFIFLSCEAFEKDKDKKFFIGLGVFSGIFFVTKIDALFYLYLIPFAIILNKSLSQKIYKFIIFSLSFFLPVSMMLVNDYIKFGYWGNGYATVANSAYYNLIPNLFFPSGILSTNPVLYLFIIQALMILIYSVKNKKPKYIWLAAIALVPLVELIVESIGRIHQENYGARHWVNDFFVIALVLMFFKNKLTNTFQKKLFRLFVVFSTIISLYKLYLFNLNNDVYFNGEPYISTFINDIFNGFAFSVINKAIMPTLMFEKLYFIPLIFIMWVIVDRFKKYFPLGRTIQILTYSMFVLYTLATVTNYQNNQLNAKLYKDVGLYSMSLIGDGPNIHSFFENVGTYEKLEKFYLYHNDLDRVTLIKKERLKYIEIAKKEIVFDPMGLTTKMDKDFFISDELRDD